MNDFWNSPRSRLLCAETLEHRWLLSGADAEVPPSDLPEHALDAFAKRFPGGEIVEAELTESADGARAYEITGELDDREVELVVPIIIAAPASPPDQPDSTATDADVEPAETSQSETAAPPIASDTPTPSSGLEVVELETADVGDEVEVEIEPAKLPAHILLALASRFPGAELIEAEFSTDADESEYGITAEFNDQLIDVSLTPQGQITEVEQSVTSGDLPEAVLRWLQQQFPDATIDEAAVVDEGGEVSYEVEFTPPGQAALEATLRVPGTVFPIDAPEVPADAVADGPAVPIGDVDDARESTTASSSRDGELAASDAEADAAAAQDVAAESSPQQSAPTAQGERAELTRATDAESAKDDAAESITLAGVRQIAALADVLEIVATAGARPAIGWLPELANSLPIDVAGVEQSLRAILGELDALAAKLVDAPANESIALRLAVVLAVVAGVELFLLESKKTRGGRAVVFTGASASWSWVLGSVTRTRKRDRS